MHVVWSDTGVAKVFCFDFSLKFTLKLADSCSLLTKKKCYCFASLNSEILRTQK